MGMSVNGPNAPDADEYIGRTSPCKSAAVIANKVVTASRNQCSIAGEGNADVLLEELAEVLRTRYEITEVKWHRKPSASRPADPKALKELTEQVDSVIIAIGD